MSKTIIESLQEHDLKVISRLMSAVENDSQTDETLIEELYSHSLNSVRIGIKNQTLLAGIYFESLFLNTIFNR